MEVQYGDACLSLQQVYEWSRKFLNGVSSPRLGQAHHIVTPEAIAAVEAIVKENHYHQPETKKASKEWRRTSSPKLKKFCTQPSAGKVMLTLFRDDRGVILEHYMPRGNTVTSTMYADLKNHLHPAIKSKQRGLLSTGVLLQHDNARAHTARSTVATIQDLSLECLLHPPYSPDLAPKYVEKCKSRHCFYMHRYFS